MGCGGRNQTKGKGLYIMSGRGTFDNPRQIGIAKIYADSSGRLRWFYDANNKPVLLEGDGRILVGGSDDVRVVSTYAELKAACEDANVHTVYCLPGTYTGSTTIAPTSYSHIIGVGHVQLDWSGAVNAAMFRNASATHVIFTNIQFVKSGNSYYALFFHDDWRIERCNTVASVYLATETDSVRNGIENCPSIAGNLVIYTVNLWISNSGISGTLSLYPSARIIRIVDCNLIGAWSLINLYANSGEAEDRDIIVSGTTINATSSTVGCIFFRTLAAGAITIKNIKVIGCTLIPKTAEECIDVQDTADLTVAGVLFDGNTFRDGAVAYNIPSNPTVARWRFNNNTYDNVTTVYNFTDPGDFVYCLDGN